VLTRSAALASFSRFSKRASSAAMRTGKGRVPELAVPTWTALAGDHELSGVPAGRNVAHPGDRDLHRAGGRIKHPQRDGLDRWGGKPSETGAQARTADTTSASGAGSLEK